MFPEALAPGLGVKLPPFGRLGASFGEERVICGATEGGGCWGDGAGGEH